MLDLSTLSQSDRDLLIRYHESQLDDLRALASVPGVERPPAPAPAPAPPAEDIHPGFGSKENEAGFYNFLRDNKLLGPKISGDEFRGCDAITRACAEAKWGISWTAYALATAYLETAHTMLPVKEAYWLKPAAQIKYYTRMYDITGSRPAKARELGNLTPGDGSKYPGMGYPQMTGRKNFEKASAKLGVDLVNHPERALEPEIAAQIMVRGMREGWFTSRDIDDDLPAHGPATEQQFVKSRDIINGTDRQADVADYAMSFQSALQAGNWQF